MTQYVAMISNHASAIDPRARAAVGGCAPPAKDSPFCYMDTASSRASITSINYKLAECRVAIVGLGGTGSYILDLVAKTPVKGIDVFDADEFSNHNAFRSPGAPSEDDLSKHATKADWFYAIYSRMHKNITKHPYRVDESNVSELNGMDIVFLCVDDPASRKTITGHLVENNVKFIDVGMGLLNENGSLTGSCRVTTWTRANSNAISRLPTSGGESDEYSSNIQIADLNSLNAALAVIRWKRMSGFYHDNQDEHNTVYSVASNALINDDETKGNRAQVR